MSRFGVNVSEFEQSSLSDDQTRELFAYIEKKIPKLINISKSVVKHMLRNHLDYRLITVSNDYVIVIRKSKTTESYICIGYPFPIISKKTDECLFDGFCVNYYIRGKRLRNAQRARLIRKLRENNKCCDIKYYYTRFGLRRALKRYITNISKNIVYYIDLYRFIGDSFLSMYMLDAFVKDFNAKHAIVLSNQASKLSGFYKTMSLNDWHKVQNNSIYIFSDLLDIDDAWVQKLATNQPKNGIYILNSRNSFFVKNSDAVQYFAIKNKSDILFTFGNIFSYMNRCISSFIKTRIKVKKATIRRKKTKRIYINPFSSLEQKSLSEQELFCLVNQLKTKMPYIDIFLPFGHDQKNKKYSGKCSKKLQLKRLQDDGFYDLVHKLHLNHIDLIITTDTALTHIATKYNIKNIVIFKSGFWDSMSLQSLAAESPMSFISENSCQLPVVLPQIENKDFHKVLDIMNSIQNANRFGTDKTYNFCSYKFSLFKNIALLRLRRLLGSKRKLMHYKKGK